ncbi:hypothetical protein HKBW3C_01943, partial [Candidatus Hakubella thermalkaliphila]
MRAQTTIPTMEEQEEERAIDLDDNVDFTKGDIMGPRVT